MRAALTTSALTIGYNRSQGNTVLLENLHLELFAGELVCFMGPNGIGKSSLIRTLAGLQKPLSGEIFTTNKGAQEKEISVVLTDKVSSGNLTVYDIVALGRYPYIGWNVSLSASDKEVIHQAIQHVHIEHLKEKPLYELSDGQLQMVMIARAIAQDTPIILLDEPTAHLDLNNRVETMKLLRRLAKTMQKAILVATHELDLALQTADRVWLTTLNKNILSGIPEDLVLDGSFDAIFRFKGFDLKTGRVQHHADKGIEVSLTGDGYEYLWTKNALERNGFEVSGRKTIPHVTILKNKNSTQWFLYKEDTELQIASLEELIKNL